MGGVGRIVENSGGAIAIGRVDRVVGDRIIVVLAPTGEVPDRMVVVVSWTGDFFNRGLI